MSSADLITWLIIIGGIAFLAFRHKRKKAKEAQTATANTTGNAPYSVRTSEPFPTMGNMGFVGSTGNGLTAYPSRARVEVVAFNFRDSAFQSMEALQLAISAKLERMLLNCDAVDAQPYFQYVTVGTTLLLICVYSANNSLDAYSNIDG